MIRVEDMLFSGLLASADFARQTLHYIEPDFFDEPSDKHLIKMIRKFHEDHNAIPTKQILLIELQDSKLNQVDFDKTKFLIEDLDDNKQEIDWLLKRTEQFCQEKAVFNGVMQSIAILDGRDTKHDKGAIPKILQDALAVGFDKTIGHDYFIDAEARFEFYNKKEDRVRFGLDTFNKITKGGLPRKTLNCILAGTGVGKSLFMCDHAAKAIKSGYDCLYITLEMAEERIAERIDCNLFDVSIDELHSMNQDEFSSRIKNLNAKSHGKLVIKEYPTSGAGANHFRKLLDELKTKQDFTPDVVYIDYLNICNSSRLTGGGHNSYTIVKSIAEELRGLAVEYNVCLVTATQTNRGGNNNTDVEMTDTSECISVDECVELRNGTKKRIGDVVPGDQIVANDIYKTVRFVHHPKIKECYKISTSSGKSIIVSADHVFPTSAGRMSISSGLTIGSKLCSI